MLNLYQPFEDMIIIHFLLEGLLLEEKAWQSSILNLKIYIRIIYIRLVDQQTWHVFF